MDPAEIEALFTAPDGAYRCARWGRPVAPVVFGVEDATLETVKGALAAVCGLAGVELAETDPELGANFMLFFVRDWDDLRGVPNLEKLVEGLAPLLDRLTEAGASQYRVFRFDASGAIRACFAFQRVDAGVADLPAATVALNQAVQMMLTWAEGAFAERSALAMAGERAVLRPEIAGLIRAAYDPVMPDVATDPAHALRLAARLVET